MPELEILDDVARPRITIERADSKLGCPALELPHPVRDRRVWDHDQRRERPVLYDHAKKSYDLYRFALYRRNSEDKDEEKKNHTDQTHLICENTVLKTPPIATKPVHAGYLEVHEFQATALPKFWKFFLCEYQVRRALCLAAFVRQCNLILCPHGNSDCSGCNEPSKSLFEKRPSSLSLLWWRVPCRCNRYWIWKRRLICELLTCVIS